MVARSTASRTAQWAPACRASQGPTFFQRSPRATTSATQPSA